MSIPDFMLALLKAACTLASPGSQTWFTAACPVKFCYTGGLCLYFTGLGGRSFNF